MLVIPQLYLHAISSRDLAELARQCLARQNAWFERILDEIKSVQNTPPDADLSAFIQRHAELARERARYEREFEKVTSQWRESSATIPEDVRKEIGALARRGETLSDEIRAAYETAISTLTQRTANVKSAIETLRTGRSVIRKYAPGDSPETLFIDKKS